MRRRLTQIAAAAQLGMGMVDWPALLAVLLGAAVGAAAAMWVLRSRQRE